MNNDLQWSKHYTTWGAHSNRCNINLLGLAQGHKYGAPSENVIAVIATLALPLFPWFSVG